MSPASQEKRKNNQKNERNNLKRKVMQDAVSLDDHQSDEMSSIASTIETNHQEELQKLYDEAEKHGVGHLMKEIWKEDVESHCEREQFHIDQKKNRSGSKANNWSIITIRMALAVYSRSPAAYDALKSFGILNLPCRSTLQSYTGAFLHGPGAHSDCIEQQVAQFVLHCQQRVLNGKQESKKDGVLIFDEVKVISRLMWNSRSQTLIGLSMRHDEMLSLADIFQTLSSSSVEQTSYIMQFLWRDLTSDFDIIGPYFTSSNTMDSKFSLACILETVKLFQLHGLSTSLLVCDGASSNLSLIKATHGHSGVYPILNG
ncbi:PREDICTED: uncharacterized protein LOC109584759 [Amphimedon queenslandica]|nr:PREDICTED: uncharacterized protein LOC109584759 [Amphimedon queenslandica]|eukprot:XP_019856161.1 PREDICTED: uncharacterized protein LOC109584759 [Amphimedon queenslandica]